MCFGSYFGSSISAIHCELAYKRHYLDSWQAAYENKLSMLSSFERKRVERNAQKTEQLARLLNSVLSAYPTQPGFPLFGPFNSKQELLLRFNEIRASSYSKKVSSCGIVLIVKGYGSLLKPIAICKTNNLLATASALRLDATSDKGLFAQNSQLDFIAHPDTNCGLKTPQRITACLFGNPYRLAFTPLDPLVLEVFNSFEKTPDTFFDKIMGVSSFSALKSYVVRSTNGESWIEFVELHIPITIEKRFVYESHPTHPAITLSEFSTNRYCSREQTVL